MRFMYLLCIYYGYILNANNRIRYCIKLSFFVQYIHHIICSYRVKRHTAFKGYLMRREQFIDIALIYRFRFLLRFRHGNTAVFITHDRMIRLLLLRQFIDCFLCCFFLFRACSRLGNTLRQKIDKRKSCLLYFDRALKRFNLSIVSSFNGADFGSVFLECLDYIF